MSSTATSSVNARNSEAAINVSGMNCASCVSHVTKAAMKLPGVQACDVNLARGRAVVKFDPSQTSTDSISAAITRAGYESAPEPVEDSGVDQEQLRLDKQRHHARAWRNRAVIAGLLWFPFELIHWIQYFLTDHHGQHIDWLTWTTLLTSTLAIIFVGQAFYRSAWGALRRGTSNMDTLIAMGASVAYLYSVVAMVGALKLGWRVADLYFMESTGLLALISLGHYLEARARESAGSAIRELLHFAPATALRVSPSPLAGEGRGEGKESAKSVGATRKTLSLSILSQPSQSNPEALLQSTGSSETETVPVSQLQLNDMVLIRPGDRVPIDGVVIDGRSSIDESMLTGESLPVTRSIGDAVIGGTVNHDGVLRVRVTKVGKQTALAQIIALVEKAQSSKPEIQKLADHVAAIFVPVVLVIALITGIGWYIWGTTHDWPSATTWGMLAKSVCSVLIIACPCALGLAVPAALMVGTGMGAKRGILIRDIDALQSAEKIGTIALDKTGTITQGKPHVERIEVLNGMIENDLLRLVASAEQFSTHPLAGAVVREARTRGLPLSQASHFSNLPGEGIRATVEDHDLLIGSAQMLGQTAGDSAQSEIHIGRRVNDAHIQPLGIIHLTDALKSDSIDAIRALHDLKLRIVLLSGDVRSVATTIAGQVGIDDVRAEVKPGEKASIIRQLQLNGPVAMVGDGINDAPALAQSDLGIAIGSGSDIAKETGDIVLVGSSLAGVAVAIRLSRSTMRTIRQNLFFAFVYNVLAIPLAAFGLLNPLIAAAAMALSDVTVIGNALLLRRSKIDR